MRLRRKPWISEALKDFDNLISDPKELIGNWHQYFGNKNPIHVEFGTGKGAFLSGMAKANPNINYIGFELQEGVIYYACKKARDAEVSNLALVMINVKEVRDIFEAGEVGRIYLNFSDPWPKKRHANRRLTHKDFLDLYKALTPQGTEIHFKTDNMGLFEFSLEELVREGFVLKNLSLDLHNSVFAEENIMTEYEAKFSKKGQVIYRVEAIYG